MKRRTAIGMSVAAALAVFVAALAPFAAAPVHFVAESTADLDSGFILVARISVGLMTIRCLVDITPIQAISIRTQSRGLPTRQDRLPLREPSLVLL
jgi:hypothetical protein